MSSLLNQEEAFLPSTALTVSGGVTPSVTGRWIDIYAESRVSMILVNDGTSTDLDVTYQIGYIKREDAIKGTRTAITPADGGTPAELTAANIPGSHKHGSVLTLAPGVYRFNVANADGVNTATVSLYIIFKQAIS